ncbi:PLD nuclease N-terminal domain-containing protein [Streptomyces sp. AA1529]|uniref:PLD nuclease N-terminal domain-containing protein n=1 Tax=Streptomyces sp. AA1529 TaxID=1203257 RepID=UPI003D70FBD9
MLRYLPFLLILAVWIYAFIDCLNTPENEVRKLPKVAWVIIILLFGQVLLGPVAWFAVGRPRRNAPYGATRPDERRWVAPDDNPDFLKSLNESPAPGPDSSSDAPPAPDPAPEQRGESPRDGDELPNRKDRDDS